ncbi:radical SAM protein [Paenibacillus sp. TSA_86.1]|uniref:radical SAM protein n=1 Tax=Paenibacillus sp. TSA_86.1 TaxID=3415649 RepID=UPI0040467DE4
MKSSMYNVFLETEGRYYIFNTLSSKLIEVDQKSFQSLKNNEEEINTSNLSEELERYGLVTSESVDEIRLFKHIVDKSIYDNNLRMTIVMTNNCNFRCQYCYQEKNNKSMSDEVEKSIIKFLYKNIKKYKSVYIEWFGGEPLIEKNRIIRMAKKIKEICTENRVPFISSITTNGYYLDMETFTELVDNNCIFFQITIDGTKSLHDTLRPHVSGKGTFDKITENLLNIKNSDINKRYTIAIRNNILKSKIKEYEEFFDYFNENFADDNCFKLIQKPIKDWGGESVKKLTNELVDSDYEMMEFIKKNEKRLNNNYSDLYESINSKMCYSFKENGFAINWDGSVYKCNRNIENHKIVDKNLIGEIRENGTIDENDMINSIWTDKPLEEKCNSCELLPVCFTSGCPASWIMKKSMICMKENKEEQRFLYNIEREIKDGNAIKLI